MATDTDSVHDHMTRLRMKMVQQKIANERERLQRPSSTESENDTEAQLRLQQVMLRRQELLDKIKLEQMTANDGGGGGTTRRPRSYSARRRFTPSPVPPSRRSLQDLNYYNKVNNNPNTYRNDSFRDQTIREMYINRPPDAVPLQANGAVDMNQVKHVIEHRVATPKVHHLPPIQSAPQPPQHIIQQIPQPVVQKIMPDEPKSFFNKADFMEMMMMQNAQMHQLVMQQMMMSSLPYAGGRAAPVMAAEVSSPYVQVSRSLPPVHHHHYSTLTPAVSAPPVVHHYTSLPPIGGQSLPIAAPQRIPVSPMRAARTPIPIMAPQRSRSLSPPPVATKRLVNTKKRHPFPGPKALRKFRHIGYAAMFIAKLRSLVNKNVGNRPSSVFLFGIILKEIVAALHRIYLNPSGNIYPVLADIINPKAYDLSNLIRGRANDKENAILIQELQYVVENLVYHITEIMPSTGVLGTHRKSAVFELIKNGKRFPDGYFWQSELDRLQFSQNGRTVGIGDPEAFFLLVGIFISRSLVTTLLMKPVDYGLSSQTLTDVADRNLKILATTMLYLVRRSSVPRGQAVMPLPGELSKYLYSDEDMRPIYSRLSRTFNYSEGLLRDWGQEYIRRLRQAPLANAK